MAFVNRRKELELLARMAAAEHKQMLVLYGRRRIGKTALLREFARQHRSLFFSCPLATPAEALRLLQKRMAEALEQPLLARTVFPGWHEALTHAFEQASARRVALILDEFPYLLRSVPAVDSIIQHLWDAHQGRLWIGLSGSVLSVMRDDVLGPHAPLYGRRTEQLRLAPMGFGDVSLFYEEQPFESRAHRYAFFGGVPAYAERAAAFDSTADAVVSLVLSPDGVLYQEPEFLVREELREPGNYFSILHSIASGMTRPNQIAQDAGVLHSGVNKYLETLRRMGLITRLVPITEKRPERSTKGIYRIADPFLRFYFRYVYPNRSAVEIGRGRDVYEAAIAPDLDTFMGLVYENLCRQEILLHGEDRLGFVPARVGRYWDARAGIDIVAEDASGERVAFIECNWGTKVDVERVLTRLAVKGDLVRAYAGRRKTVRVMSRTGTTHAGHIFFG